MHPILYKVLNVIRKKLENNPSSQGANKGFCPLVCPTVIEICHLF